MEDVILLEGVRDLNSFKQGRLYGFIESYFSSNQFNFHRSINGFNGFANVDYCIGHSFGTKIGILDYEKVRKGIIMLDPHPNYYNNWNKIEISKVAIISKLLNGRPWSQNYDNSIFVRDDHYFNKSFDTISETLDKIIFK